MSGLDNGCIDTVLNIILNILTLVASVAACISAWHARRAAQETHKGTQAQVVASLLDAYASEAMLDACLQLERWRNKKGARFAGEFRKLRTEDYDNIAKLDRARRQVSHYFQKVYALYTSGLLDEDLVKIVASEQQVVFYQEVLEPLEASLSPGYDRASFVDLGQLHNIARQPSEADTPWHVQ